MSFWEAILPTVLSVGATVYGANQSSKATQQAAQQTYDATQAATEAQLEGLRVAQQNLEVNRRAASPGLVATNRIIARGSKLTPEQEMAVADTRKQALNALKGSSLRGSARATSAVVNDVDTRTRNNFMTQNQNAADNAAKSLAGQYFGAGTNIANNATNQGTTISQGLTNSGIIQASNTLGQDAIKGRAIGDVGALISDALKSQVQEERGSSYGKTGEHINWNDGGRTYI